MRIGWICMAALATALSPVGGLHPSLVFPGPVAALAATPDEVAEAAEYLFARCTTVDRRGTHNLLLKAVRHMDDPAMRPLFARLAGSGHPVLKIHGILGLAETSADQQVDLALIAQIDDPAVQSTVITAAMDDKLLGNDQARQLLDWDGLAYEVKVLVAVRLIEAGEFNDTELLHGALTGSKKLGGGALAALLLMQLEDPAGGEHLRTVVDTSDDPQRDTVRAMLLQTALRHNLTRAAPWASDVAREPGVNPALGLLALRTALRFGEPGSEALWLEMYGRAEDSPAGRVRLALTVLHLSPWLDPSLFEVLQQSQDPVLHALGLAGWRIASGSSDVADPVAALLEFGHPMINHWALGYAREHASDLDAQIILLGLVLAYEHSPQRGKARRLDEAIQAVQALFEHDPDAAAKLLRPILTEPSTDKLLAQAILLGLVRTRSADAVAVVVGIEDRLNSADAKGLALLLHARSDRALDEQQMNDLALLARGGGRLEDSLRIQTAWYYLKRTGQAQQMLDRVLGNTTP